MSRLGTFDDPVFDRTGRGGFHPHAHADHGIVCVHCDHPLECVDQHGHVGTWVGCFICPNCRSEYFYTRRWGRLLPKT